jgi:GAF domain-containing protein
MGRGPTPAKGKAKPAVARKSSKNDAARVRDLEKRLAEAHEQLQTRDRELGETREQLTAAHAQVSEALEQQTATSEILRVISSSPTDVQPVFDTIVRSVTRLCRAAFSFVFLTEGGMLYHPASHGSSPEIVAAIRALFPRPLDRETAAGTAILTRSVVHVPDVLEQSAIPVARQTGRAVGYRSLLTVPMVRQGEAVGAITVNRRQPGRFSDAEVALLKTFADQAVIAMENVRLFTETKEALERQTATAEILKVISSSPTDVQPVFDAVAESAARLCGADDAVIQQVGGGELKLVAHFGGMPAPPEDDPMPITRHMAVGCAVLDRRTMHVHDMADEHRRGNYPASRSLRGRLGYRTLLCVPLVRQDVAIGVIVMRRGEVQPFTDQQISLVQTFADQAVIAIENVRLFNETKEALEQQTATANILRVISGSPTDVQPVFDAIAANAVRLCGAVNSAVFRFDGKLIHLATSHNIPGDILAPFQRLFPATLDSPTVTARAISSRATVHVEDLSKEYENTPVVQAGYRTVLSVPMMREGVPIGAVNVTRMEVQPFSPNQVALLQTFADQAVIAIENVRLFKELETRNRDLTEALAQQTATADILRVISSSPTEIQPTFEAMAAAAMTLCDADNAALFQFDGHLINFVAQHGRTPEEIDAARRVFPQPPRRHSVTGRAILANAIVQIADVSQDPELEDALRVFRTMLSVPLIRDGRSLGAITLARRVVKAFTEQQITLLRTFADQAVIAIENVRLFTELQNRTEELTRSVEQLTALGEVGQAITSTLNLQTVLTTIVARATQLTGVNAGVIYEYDEAHEVFQPRATERLEEAIVRMLEATPIRKGQGATGRLAEVPEPIQVADLRDITVHVPARDALVGAGYRAVLAVPLIREDHLIGGLTVFRKTPGEFAPDVIDLLRTFATQSALAIQNARLFREIEEKSRQLEIASQHKSEFLANMSHELRTPLNAIIGFSEILSERMFGELNEKQEEYLKDIYASGTHLLSLINDILDLSKIEAGRMELELTDFDLPTAIENALMLIRERAGRRSIALHTNIDHQLGQIQADERKIRQVVLNLLSNAIKFTPEGGRIEVRAVPVDGSVEVSVTDTGVGIAPEDQEAVFEEFRQVGTAEKKSEGTGLGLTLCRKFVELHGGRIWVASQVGVGSTFTLTIPVRRGE